MNSGVRLLFLGLIVQTIRIFGLKHLFYFLGDGNIRDKRHWLLHIEIGIRFSDQSTAIHLKCPAHPAERDYEKLIRIRALRSAVFVSALIRPVRDDLVSIGRLHCVR
jgi:hypothetical protein